MVPEASQTNSSDYFEEDDSQFLEALRNAVLPGDIVEQQPSQGSTESQDLEPPPPAQPRKRRYSQLENEERIINVDPEDDTYGPAHFGDFGEYMRRKRAKLQIQNAHASQLGESGANGKDGIFTGLAIYVRSITIIMPVLAVSRYSTR